ncbi:hypothetical protein M413DRAFT_446685 [Hebeloma cylindrosporum]|uniref:Uncharacterized protein n=1 Tax=Hebeloma cylindrosporum TaxID=76867 RepID=A0A0C3BSW4_HEBCY|nr:hypothetical protein M413DRAFT_446685 [Hebeloma cylindrosporum h7]
MDPLPVQRPGSIRSVASNSSIASGVSLARRPRTRTRSRTVTGGSMRPEDIPQFPASSDLPYLNSPISQEPVGEQAISRLIPLTAPPLRPPRSPQRQEPVEIRSSDGASSQGATADLTIVEPLPPTNIGRPSKAAKQASNLPLLDTGYKPPPSAFSRDPALTPVVNVRDSVSTQKSGASSSLYPPSTSTASAPESPTSPMSMAGQPDNPPFSLEVNDVQEYDSDDVSYRLRLLVKNNYFLPPAHSKPSPADFASTSLNAAKKSPRAATPTFLDIFRVGKSRSKPTTPTGTPPGFDPMAPMLRTTADSIAAPYALSPLPRLSSQFPHLSPHMPNPASRGRVVVVREKMNDIAVAAKQAEQDLKARGVRQEQGSQKATPTAADDVIDPTDAVDIPLLSASYPFAVQASALHGLGVLESVGADVLADRLPPSKNPNLSASYDTAEDSWRKALLHEAVHHSLDNTPDVSAFSHAPLGSSTPFGSLRSKAANTPRVESPNPTQLLINQKILAQPILENFADSKGGKHMRQKSGQSQASASRPGRNGSLAIPVADTTHDSSRPSSYLPQRVETPSGPMTPLGPPARRHFVNPLYSLSQTSLAYSPQSSKDSPSRLSNDPRPALRRTVSSPMLADGYDSSVARRDLTTSSQGLSYPRDSLATVTSFNTVRGSYDHSGGRPVEVHDSENEDLPRNSLALSAMRSRPSLSEYSQASVSPTTSTFQDMLNHESSSSNHAGPSRFSLEQHAILHGTPSPRTNAMSPPPRLSSSLAHAALPPPPRSATSSQLSRRVFSPPPILSSSESHSNHTRQADSEDSTFQIVAPEPTTPPFPLSDRRNHPTDDPLSIDISPVMSPVALHSTAGPTSPTSFFDSIQTQPNAMDDLESSSDESEDDEPSPPPPKLFVDPRTRAISSAAANPRPLVMRHGNFSTPYLRHGETFRQNLLPLGTVSSKQAIVNNPPRAPKSDILSSSDFFKYAQEHPPNITSALNVDLKATRRPSTGSSDPVTTWRNNQKAQESLRKLDGMLIQHMEDEKDTIKRIATTMKQTADSHFSNLPDRP